MSRSSPSVPFVVAIAAVIALAGCYKSSGSGTAAAPLAAAGTVMPAGVTSAMIAEGDSLYNSGRCQRCHGKQGIGAQNGPSLIDGEWTHIKGGFDEIVAVVTTGIPKAQFVDQTRRFAMDSRGGTMNLSDDQVRAVAAYVWSISRDRK